MLVKLQRPWFDGESYHAVSPVGVEVPEKFRDRLPKGAEILTTVGEVLEEIPKMKPMALSEMAKRKPAAKSTDNTFSQLGKTLEPDDE